MTIAIVTPEHETLDLSPENERFMISFLNTLSSFRKDPSLDNRLAIEDALGAILIKCQKLENQLRDSKCTQSPS